MRTNVTYYRDNVRQLTLYVPSGQRGGKQWSDEGNKGGPLVLDTMDNKDKGKR